MEALDQFVGFVAELVDREGPTEGIPAGGRQAADEQAESEAQEPGEPGQAVPYARATEVTVVPPNSSSQPSPERATVRPLRRASRHTRLGWQLGGMAKRSE